MARNPSIQEELVAELAEIDIYDQAELQGCDFLTAVINETLRLHPPVPTGGYRQSPPEGMTINETYIPGNVTIVSPRHSLARLESSYERPGDFVPWRWTTQPNMVKDKRGFAPFSQGRFSCVGKGLAMRQMRFVIALLISKFEVGFWGDEQGEELLNDMRDHFTAALGKLNLRFRKRA